MDRELSVLEKSLIQNINKKFGKDNPMTQLSKDSAYGKPRGWIDTGIYSLNWIISGDINGGWPVGRISELDGDPSTGKSLLCEMAMRDPTVDLIIYFDTEAAMNIEFLKFLGVDISKVLYQPIDTVEQLQETCAEVLNTIVTNKLINKKVLMIIDSVALASTEKEMDPEKGCYTGDTLVHTVNGTKKIEDVNIGDKVLTHLATYEEVEEKYEFSREEREELIIITTDDNEEIKLTPEHKLLVNREDGPAWLEAQELLEEDEILSLIIS